jgi:hypothetical protein
MLVTAVGLAIIGGLAYYFGSRGGCTITCLDVSCEMGGAKPTCRCQEWEGLLQWLGILLIPVVLVVFFVGLALFNRD